MVETNYKPVRKSLDSVTLADDYSLKGRKIAKYSYKGGEKLVNSWVEMYLELMATLHTENPLVLLQLATDKTEKDLSLWVSDNPSDPSKYSKLEDDLFLFTHSNTDTKISLLRRFFNIYGIEEEELVFYLQDDTKKLEDLEGNGAPRNVIRLKFWDTALPVLREKTGRFTNVNPSVSNWQSTYFGRGGLNISAIGNLDNLRVDLYIGTSDPKLNNQIFEYLESRKDLIEKNSNTKFIWTNEPQNRTAKIGIENPSFGIENEELWEDCVGFLAQGVNTMANHVLPMLDEFYEERY